MKRFLSALLSLAILSTFAFFAVASEVVEEDTTSTEDITSSEDISSTTEATPAKTWEKDYYVDDFDEPTDKWFVRGYFIGMYSNTYATNSNLDGYIFIDAEDISIFLFKHGNLQVKNSYSYREEYAISVRLADGTTKEFSGYMPSEGDRIFIQKSQISTFKELLINGGNLKFYIYEKDDSLSSYSFEISSDNLKDLIG